MQVPLMIRAAAVLCALALAHCAVNPVTGNPNFVTMSESQEVNVGRTEDKKVREQYGIYEDAVLQRYVNDIGQRLAKASHRAGLNYQFLVVDSPEINTFALPGGYITRGILGYLNSEAELAAVLGHEIGHVTARHSVQQMSASTATNVAVVFLGKSAFAIGQQANSTETFRQHAAAMDAAMKSFHPITAGERALAKPLRMRVIPVRADLIFAELAHTSPLGHFAEDHLRVLNGLYPRGEPVAGQPLKIVE